MLGHVILISAQVQSKAGVPVLEAVTFGASSPRCSAARRPACRCSGTRWSGYVGLRSVQRGERRAQRPRLADSQVQLQEQRALADRSRGLEQLLELRDRSNLNTMAAEIIAAGATPDFRTVTIDKGSLKRHQGRHGRDRAGRRRRARGRVRRRARRRCSSSSIATRRPAPLSSARARRAPSSAAATAGCGWNTSPRRRTSRRATS